MKERGISQRVNRIVSIDLNKPLLIDSLNFISDLLHNNNEGSNIALLLKEYKMNKYKDLIQQLTPVVNQFSTLKKAHNDLIKNLQQLDIEIDSCIEKTSNAIKTGKNINLELISIKSKRQVLDSVLTKVDSSEEKLRFS